MDYVEIIIDRDHTYQLDTSRKRTLPAGWTGRVAKDVADDVESSENGRIVTPEPAPKPKRKRAVKPKAKAKPKAAETSASAPGVTNANPDGTDPDASNA